MKVINGKFIKIEIIEHSEQDKKDFDMEHDKTTIVSIPEMVFSVNYKADEEVEAQEFVRDKIKLYVAELAKEISNI